MFRAGGHQVIEGPAMELTSLSDHLCHKTNPGTPLPDDPLARVVSGVIARIAL